MIKLVLIRHGESLWNLENRFTGWEDIDLSTFGEQQAREAGIILRNNGFEFDRAYTSFLKRAIRTLNIVLDEMDQSWVPVVKDWHWNEKHYGALQGLNKKDTARQYGVEQVQRWRRGYDIPPPPLEKSDERYPGKDRRYAHLKESELPLTESLEMTVNRLKSVLEETVFSDLREGKHVIITAHGNSIRAFVKILDQLSSNNIIDVEIPTGVPLVYELDQSLNPIKNYFIGNEDKDRAAAYNLENHNDMI